MTAFPAIALSDPAELDLIGYRGDSGTFRVTVTEGGAPLDVSTATWDCDVRGTPDGAVLATMTVTPVAGMTNAVDVELTAEQSALVTMPNDPDADPAAERPPAVWDLEMTLAGETTTLLRGKVTMTPDVSRPAVTSIPEGGGPEGPPPRAAAPMGLPTPVGELAHTGPDVRGAVPVASTAPASSLHQANGA